MLETPIGDAASVSRPASAAGGTDGVRLSRSVSTCPKAASGPEVGVLACPLEPSRRAFSAGHPPHRRADTPAAGSPVGVDAAVVDAEAAGGHPLRPDARPHGIAAQEHPPRRVRLHWPERC